jgi:hypothetical protein
LKYPRPARPPANPATRTSSESWKLAKLVDQVTLQALRKIQIGRRPQFSWILKTTSILLKMEDDLNILKNGNFLQMEDNFIIWQIKDDRNI